MPSRHGAIAGIFSVQLSGEPTHRSSPQLVALMMLLALMLFMAAPAPASAQARGFIRDTEIEALLNDYAQPIFRAAGLGGRRIRMRIVNDRSFNAFVLDGRNVFMNSGTLLNSLTPNQVIGIIAHETGHIAGGHLAGLRAKVQRDATRNLLMKILGVGALIAGSTIEGAESAAGAGQGILSGADTVTMRSILTYRQAQESAADQAGLAYLTATRQSAIGMIETFETFAQQELFSDNQKDPYVRSHPIARDRINQLRVRSERSPYFNQKDPPELQLRHDLMRAKLSGFLDRPQTVFNRYPESDQSIAAQYARAIASFFAGGLNNALPRVDALIKARPNYAYFWELKGDLLMRAGQNEAAIAPLRKTLTLDPDADLVRIQLAQALLNQSRANAPEVVTLLRKALVSEDSSIGYRQLANAYWQTGAQAEAFLASAQASLLEGQLEDAKGFAKRAQAQMKPGTPGWTKADDIINFRPNG